MTDIKSADDQPDFVGKRNERLLRFFWENGYGYYSIRIIGKENNPAVILDDEWLLPCYVHNFNLCWCDKPSHGEIIKTFKLTDKVQTKDEDGEDINRVIEQLLTITEKKKMYKIQLEGTDLFVSGWNYIVPDKKYHYYPVFGKHKPKLFHTIERAQDLCKELEELKYKCKPV